MDELQPDHILQVGLGFWASKTLLSAVEMEVFTELAKHPEDLETLQGRLGLHQRPARDFFDALVALKFLERRDGRYYNTPSTNFFLDIELGAGHFSRARDSARHERGCCALLGTRDLAANRRQLDSGVAPVHN